MGKVDEFVNQFRSKGTKRLYRWALTQFYQCVYEKGMKLEDAVERYFVEERNYKADVRKFLSAINERPPKSVKSMLSIVRGFLLENEVELGEMFWKRLRRRVKGSRAVSMEKVPSNVELRRILTHLPVRGKALYLMLASSGMRIGEAINLQLEEVDLDAEPVKVHIRGEIAKSGNKRVAFVSKEAQEAIREWLNVREDYLEMAVARSTFYDKSKEDTRLFPFDVKQAYVMWNEALDKTKLNGRDVRTRRHKIHPHTLRKFFRSKAGAFSVDEAEALMGHEGYLTAVYRKYPDPEKTLAEFYEKVEPSLAIFGSPAIDLEKVKEEVTMEARVEIKLLKEKIGKLEEEIEDLSERYLFSAKAFEKTAKMVDDMSKAIVKLMDEKVKTS